MSVGQGRPDRSPPTAPPAEPSVPAGSGADAHPIDLDPVTAALLRRLLTLPAGAARRVRAEAPRRRSRRPQTGPSLDLGSAQ